MQHRNPVAQQRPDEPGHDSVPQRVESDRRFEDSTLGDGKWKNTTNSVQKPLLIEEVPVVSAGAQWQKALAHALAGFSCDDVSGGVHEGCDVDGKGQDA